MKQFTLLMLLATTIQVAMTTGYILPQKFTTAQIIIGDKNGEIVKPVNVRVRVKEHSMLMLQHLPPALIIIL